MKVHLLAISILLLSTAFTYTYASQCEEAPCGDTPKATKIADKSEEEPKPVIPQDLDGILAKLKKQNDQLKTYQGNIEYILVQDPDLIDSTTIRTGKIYYSRNDKKSQLKIRFDKRKEDDEKAMTRIEEYLFDGVWLRVVDHQNKTINSYQKAPADKPVDAFELISRDFPIIGFTSSQNLRKQFQVTLVEDDKDPKTALRLKLKPKKGTDFAKNYAEIDFYIDKMTFMPARLRTRSIEGDIYDFRFTDTKINKKLKESVFLIEKSANFTENTHPLKKE